ncbi:hypothetical protein [Winogradskyella tangerina]|uniref:hypothetical protein n=1 Tax=Winogradskyella tangerina TaxID=2023240 RepID=UPI000DBE4F4E|nr:hypothetical protein [Winogradskyella tangerina]
MNILKSIKYKLNTLLGRDVLFPENRELILHFQQYSKAYILGSAPSINEIDFSLFDKDALVISMGNFHEHPEIKGINPGIHIFAASHPPLTDKIIKLWYARAEERLPKDTIVLVEARDFEIASSVFKTHRVYQYAYGGTFPSSFTKRIMAPTSVAIVALQLGYYLGLEDLNLLGIDHDWQTTKGYGHFYDHDKPSLEFFLKEEGIITDTLAYQGRQPKGRLYKFYAMYMQYEQFNDPNLRPNFKIYNADPLSEFDVFEKRDYNTK